MAYASCSPPPSPISTMVTGYWYSTRACAAHARSPYHYYFLMLPVLCFPPPPPRGPQVRCMDVLSGEELHLPVNLASRLVLSNPAFATQFISAGEQPLVHLPRPPKRPMCSATAAGLFATPF